MKVRLKVWRQRDEASPGSFQLYDTPELNPNMSFLEMLDVVNEDLTARGDEPIAFDHDCREGICGACSLVIDGKPHGPHRGVASCQTYMRSFRDGDEVVVEPFRARAFPLVRDLVVDRSAFDRVMQAGGFISVRTGGAPDANAIPVPKETADLAMDAAACIGCGACVAACKNASAMLFVSAKVSQLNLLPQGQPEKHRRVLAMVGQMDAEGFGGCTVTGSCEAVCPKEISLDFIAQLNRDYLCALIKGDAKKVKSGGA
ncbi:MAG TPA: succinate dehydrogenase/fumarate reductase iron-sulfur subunit [Candidatus Saccharimonadales bacterium]|nr:succinate dehydrogenase/fumarate reductase iron-sulfur subunit [Candidatus Saccharimonadales bacterium]